MFSLAFTVFHLHLPIRNLMVKSKSGCRMGRKVKRIANGEFPGSREGGPVFRARHESIQAICSVSGLVCRARDGRKLLCNR
ncbi:hypothetical protein CEXT_562411 [Caerostris extrusa]|uniref:Secreted protein n=1 Tax=Caerostris extrusa TaxID=172846 RepID=A0AAV4P403_CAEEX|nr:hypothetical protein CEXT_562411 [Caerostris extrusa]